MALRIESRASTAELSGKKVSRERHRRRERRVWSDKLRQSHPWKAAKSQVHIKGITTASLQVETPYDRGPPPSNVRPTVAPSLCDYDHGPY